jgi:hypothetical protein
MPRGYLTHQSRSVGRKQSRGGHGRHVDFHRSWRKWDWIGQSRQRLLDSWWDVHMDDAVVVTYDYRYEHETDCDDMGSYVTEDEDISVADVDDPDAVTPEEEAGAVGVVIVETIRRPTTPTLSHCPAFVTSSGSNDGDGCTNVETLEEEDPFDPDLFDATVSLDGLTFVNMPNGCTAVENSSDASFSLCDHTTVTDDNTRCDEEDSCRTDSDRFSFCNVSTSMAKHMDTTIMKDRADDQSSVTTVSTIWEFVSEGLGFESVANPSNVQDAAVASQDCHSMMIPSTAAAAPTGNVPPTTHKLRQCTICWESKPSLQPFMSRCRHPAACQACLRSYYFDHQIQDLDNFPLQCFWPDCHRPVRDTQMRLIVKNGREMGEYYNQESSARAARREARELAEAQAKRATLMEWNLRCREKCDLCGEAQVVYPGRSVSPPTPPPPGSRGRQQHCSCYHCHHCQPMSLSVQDVRSIVTATNDDLVNCPSCVALITKNGGCDEMICALCFKVFSFAAAQAQMCCAKRVLGAVALFVPTANSNNNGGTTTP